jgi:hypothetical protein
MAFDTPFIRSPRDDLYSLGRIGGVKATESGFLLFGNGAEEILEFIETPASVAVAWRDELGGLMDSLQRGRRASQIDWLGVAAQVDAKWATENGWVAAEETTEE